MNPIAAAVGFRFFERRWAGWEARFSWAEITSGWGFAVALCLFEDHYSLHLHVGWPNVFIKLPILQRWHREPHEMMECWGFSWFGQGAPAGGEIHLNWGRRCKIVHMPWSWTWVRTSYLLSDGVTWGHDLGRRYRVLGAATGHPDQFGLFRKLPKWSRALPYRYVLRSGEVQERTATIEVQEMEWRWRWLKRLPVPRMVRRSIDVNFDGEVGERSGTWKGGVLGCGYELRPDETPAECLRRMEREREF